MFHLLGALYMQSGVCTQQTLRRREDPRRTAQARRQGQQAHDPKVHAGRAARQTARAAPVHVSTKPRPGDLGLRLSASYDVFFRSIFAFVFIELATRKVVLAATTRFPSQAWVTQQLRNATPCGAGPRFLIRDGDDKFGTAFDALGRATGIRVVRTAVRAPNMNAVCERFLGSLRRECLDHVLVLDARHLQRVVAEYVRYHNAARPHQGIRQQTVTAGPRGSQFRRDRRGPGSQANFEFLTARREQPESSSSTIRARMRARVSAS